MDLSLMYEINTVDPDDRDEVHQRYREMVEQVELADKLGYRTAWFTEHHFLPGLSHSSASEVTLSYLAGRTKDIRLGHAVTLLPHAINHPLRVAERVATLDLLSGGRVEFGGGRSITVAELLAFGVKPEDSRSQYIDAFKLIPTAWTSETISWESEWLSVPERKITPYPVQKPHPPMWTAATQPATIEFAGKHGLGCLTFGVSYKAAKESIDAYRKAQAEADPADTFGAFANNRFGLWVHCLCADTDEKALEIQGPNFKLYHDRISEIFKPWIDGEPPRSYEYFLETWRDMEAMAKKVTTEEIVAAGGAAIGSVDTVGQVLHTMAEAGVDEALLYMQGYDTPHEDILHSLELIAEKIMPNLA